MTNGHDYSTDEAAQPRYRRHGRVKVHIDGNIVRYENLGPFNEELISAYSQIQEAITPDLVAQGRWATVSVFKESAMMPCEVLDAFGVYLKTIRARGLAPCASAFVIASDVEGYHVMRSFYDKCFADSGWPFMAFDTLAEAETWIQGKLQG